MNCQCKIKLLSIIFGIFAGFVDTIIDWLIFYTPLSFMDIAIFNIPSHAIYMRISMLILFIIFGLIASNILKSKQKLKKELKRQQTHLVYLRKILNQIDSEDNFEEKDRNKIVNE